MSQTGYTPIQLYRTTTSGAAPVSGNLNPGELAININDTDMALYAKNNTGTVKRLINNPAGLKYPTTDGTANQAVVTDGAGNLSLGTPASATTATTATNLAGGGAGSVPYQSGSGTTTFLSAGTSGQLLTSGGSGALTWSTPGASPKTISNQTAAYTVVAGDLGKIINCTSGTFSVNLTAAATLGTGFTCTIWNSSTTATDAITIDPAGAETIDGVATLVLRQGEGTDIVCNGTNWETSYKKTMRGYAENYTNSAVRPIASANYSTAIGVNSAGAGSQAVTGTGAMALGGSYASGTDSFSAGIGVNSSTYGAKGDMSVAIGNYCSARGANSITIGRNCFATGVSSVALGGDSLYGNSAEGAQSVSIGFGVRTTKYGQYAYACGKFSSAGDAQYGQMVLRAATTTTTAVVLTSDAAAASTTNQLILASGQAMTFFGTIIAKQTASANMASYTITGSIVNNAGTVSISSILVNTIVDTIGLGAVPTFTADNTNKALAVTSGYKAATSIRWVANLQSVEVTYA